MSSDSSDPSDPTDPLNGLAGRESEHRRAASARFDVAKKGGSGDAMDMRDALDPATHSLGEALKLSYRILQLGIVALVVMFLFSGVQSVQEGDTGVKTLFGAIAGAEGDEQLTPGLQPFWPYPVGDLVVFPSRHTLSMHREFWPASRSRGDMRPPTLQEQIDAADPNAGLAPGADFSLLTRDGDIAHAQFEVEYVVSDAVKFLEMTEPTKADRIVAAVMRQGAVEAASSLTLAEITDTRDQLGPAVRESAQRVLDRLDSGIEIMAVRAIERVAPLAVMNRFREVQTSRENSKTFVEVARQAAITELTSIAGGEVYLELLTLIRQYETALDSSNPLDSEKVLLAIGERMSAPDVGGEIARTVLRAKASESSMLARLERETQRIDGLAASFRDSNAQIVQQLWLDAVREVYLNPQAEVFAAPNALGMLNLRMASSSDIMQDRRNSEIQRKKAIEAARAAGGYYAPGTEQISIGKGGGRRLNRDAQTGFGRD